MLKKFWREMFISQGNFSMEGGGIPSLKKNLKSFRTKKSFNEVVSKIFRYRHRESQFIISYNLTSNIIKFLFFAYCVYKTKETDRGRIRQLLNINEDFWSKSKIISLLLLHYD